jgi:hypothetical protein
VGSITKDRHLAAVQCRQRRPHGVDIGAQDRNPLPVPRRLGVTHIMHPDRGYRKSQKIPALTVEDGDLLWIAPPAGLEPATLRLTVECSAN